jgi:putative addiction module component (TIGR02574 family)
MKTQALIAEAMALPLEERARVADTLLRSLNPVDAENDAQWAALAKRRPQEIRSGRVQPVAGDKVLERVWKRLGK